MRAKFITIGIRKETPISMCKYLMLIRRSRGD